MFQRILIATDGSAQARLAEDQAMQLAGETGAHLFAVMVSEMWSATEMVRRVDAHESFPIQHYEAAEAAIAQGVLSSLEERAKAADVACTTRHISDSHPAEGVLAVATEVGADLIVVGTHGRTGLGRLMVGSRAWEIISHSKVPVLVAR